MVASLKTVAYIDTPFLNIHLNSQLAVWVLATLFLIYAKVCVAGVMRKQGRRALLWAGASTQVGSLLGATTGFLLVNEFDVFKQAGYC